MKSLVKMQPWMVICATWNCHPSRASDQGCDTDLEPMEPLWKAYLVAGVRHYRMKNTRNNTVSHISITYPYISHIRCLGLGPIWTILNNQSYLPSFEYHVIGNKLPDPSRDGFQCPSMENVGWCFTGPITLQGYTGIMSVYMNTHPPVMTWFPISYVVVRCEITKQKKTSKQS